MILVIGACFATIGSGTFLDPQIEEHTPGVHGQSLHNPILEAWRLIGELSELSNRLHQIIERSLSLRDRLSHAVLHDPALKVYRLPDWRWQFDPGGILEHQTSSRISSQREIDECIILLMLTILTVLLTASITLVTFIVGQVFVKMADPAFQIRAEIGAIAKDLVFYANKKLDLADDKQLMKVYRTHAARLEELMATIVWYKLFAFVFRLPRKIEILHVIGALMSLSYAQEEHRLNKHTLELHITDQLNLRPLMVHEQQQLKNAGYHLRSEAFVATWRTRAASLWHRLTRYRPKQL